MIDNEAVNALVIRLHKEVGEASRTIGKVRRYGQPSAKARLVSACRTRLENVISELKTLEKAYEQAYNRAVTPTGSGTEDGTDTETLGTGGPGLVEGGEGETGRQADTIVQNPLEFSI